jgi:copper chaperone
MSKTYNVGGMTCGGCAKSVAAAITKAAPAATVTVDHGAGKVTVDAAVTADTVKTAVEAAGFDYLGEAA